MHYNFFCWAMFFFIYCFLGWCLESAIVSVSERRLTNRGFLKGPALPIYGVGAVLIIFTTLPFEGNIFLQYIVGVVVCSALEYVTGALMEAIFKTKFWDYSGCFLNIKGRICLKSSLFWGVLTLFVIYFIHDPMAAFIFKHIHMTAIIAIDIVFGALMLTDLVFSVKAAFTLSQISEALDKINSQLEAAKQEARDALSVRAEEIADRLDDMNDSFRDMGQEFSQKIADLRRRRSEALAGAGFFVRELVKNNPTARHKKFAEGYNLLKAHVNKKIGNIKNS